MQLAQVIEAQALDGFFRGYGDHSNIKYPPAVTD